MRGGGRQRARDEDTTEEAAGGSDVGFGLVHN